jgi:hypothetical protein
MEVELQLNIKVLVILILTVAALVLLYLFTLGPLYQNANTIVANPDSLKAAKAETITVGQQPLAFNQYHNRDLVENYYTVKLPTDWQMQKSEGKGGYVIKKDNATITIELMDVPDNSTLELYVLSQQEPGFEASPGYKRLSYAATTINGNQDCRLVYTAKRDGKSWQFRRDYIAGADRAIAASLEAPQGEFAGYAPVYEAVLGSFGWDVK